jgi:hypothetical protein
MKNFLPSNVLLTLYNSLFLPYLNYGMLCWRSKINSLVKLQKKVVRIISCSKYNAHTEPIFKTVKLLKVDDLCALQEWKFCYKLENDMLPAYFQTDIFIKSESVHRHNTRSANTFRIPRIKHEYARNSIQYIIPIAYNNSPLLIRSKIYTHSISGFINYIKHYFISNYSSSCIIRNCYVCQS